MADMFHQPAECSTCIHWTGERQGAGKELEANREGECRRYPPTVHLAPVRTLTGDGLAPMGFFPICRSTISCGEFKPRIPVVG